MKAMIKKAEMMMWRNLEDDDEGLNDDHNTDDDNNDDDDIDQNTLFDT